jgi:hypothetical protein
VVVHNLSTIVGGGNVTWRIYVEASRYIEIDRAGIQSFLTGPQRQNVAVVAATAALALQMLVDAPDRVLLSDLTIDTREKTIDPARPDFFHARVVPGEQIGQGANHIDVYRPVALVGGIATHLVGRAAIVIVAGTALDNLTVGFTAPSVLL